MITRLWSYLLCPILPSISTTVRVLDLAHPHCRAPSYPYSRTRFPLLSRVRCEGGGHRLWVGVGWHQRGWSRVACLPRAELRWRPPATSLSRPVSVRSKAAIPTRSGQRGGGSNQWQPSEANGRCIISRPRPLPSSPSRALLIHDGELEIQPHPRPRCSTRRQTRIETT